MERDGWACQCCESKTKTLAVHHIIYRGDPWEVEDKYLQTLCEKCHSDLGPHPKGGIYWKDDFFYCIHCPLCGSNEFKDKGSYSKCLGCGYTVEPYSWPQGFPVWAICTDPEGGHIV